MPDRDLLDLLRRISDVCAPIGGDEPTEIQRHYLEFLALFDRCRSVLGAIQLLLRHDLSHEAMVLCRPLFTDSLALAEVAAADESRRVVLSLGWALDSLGSFEGMIRQAAAYRQDVGDELAKVAKRRGELEAYARRRAGQVPRHWRPDDNAKRLAKKHGRTDEYLDLLMLHQFVHGSTLAVAQRYAQGADEIVRVGGDAADSERWADTTGLFAGHSMLHAARASCAIFGWKEPQSLKELFAAVEVQSERLHSEIS